MAKVNRIEIDYGPNINPALLNDVPYMTPEEIIAQRTTVKEMCKIVHK